MKDNTYATEGLELILNAKATLGEGSFWNYRDKTLWWVDIEGKKLHIFNPESKENRSIDVGKRIGTVVPAENGGAIVALQNGIHHLDLEQESLSLIINPLEEITNIRFNDGKCDPEGRFWVGTMELDEKENASSLYKLNLNGTFDEMIEDVTISNGIIWSLDKNTMYYIDTPTLQVMAYDYEPGSGAISNGKVIIQIPEDMGSPDGMTIDAEGKLWIALFGGYGVGRWDPVSGKLLQKIKVPAPNVTSCAFGGENLDILYITTGREGLDDDKLNEFPGSGGLFSIRPGYKGVPLNFYKGQL
jgi:sugar lactone lactonase YvrE